MPISLEKANQHVEIWSQNLRLYPSRKFWPKYLFHSCQMEAAVELIRSNQLLPRNSLREIICDVANQGALWNNPNAHSFSRLYFRPRNGFHLKTEGIKTRCDPYRGDPHMSLPVTFCFDLTTVLTLPNAFFLPENFALNNSPPLSGDQNYEQLNFEDIYHDAPVKSEDKERIHRARMAEVVIDGGLSFDHLKHVVCRTIHEKKTLLHLLESGKVLSPSVVVERSGGVFMNRGIFIQEIYANDGCPIIKFRGTLDYPQDDYEIKVWSGSKCYQGRLKAGSWRFTSLEANDPREIWRVEIEGCLAYCGPIPLSSQNIV